MPSEPRTPTEPTLEELSAYLDHELDGNAQARVAEHVPGCQDCQARLDGLRQTAYAVRALPMETPPRAFTIPAQRRQSFRWAPVGWLGGTAAALLVIVFGVTQLHFNGPAATSSTSTVSGGLAAAPYKQVAPTGGQTYGNDQFAAPARSLANSTTASDPRQPVRSLELSSDATSYPAGGTMTVQVRITGLASNQVTAVRLLLERSGYAVELPTPSHGPTVPTGFQGSYTLSKLALSNPVAGAYTLIAIEQLPGGDGGTLVARLPIMIGG
jgi:negative regulator of sigma E activity